MKVKCPSSCEKRGFRIWTGPPFGFVLKNAPKRSPPRQCADACSHRRKEVDAWPATLGRIRCQGSNQRTNRHPCRSIHRAVAISNGFHTVGFTRLRSDLVGSSRMKPNNPARAIRVIRAIRGLPPAGSGRIESDRTGLPAHFRALLRCHLPFPAPASFIVGQRI